MQQRPLVHHLDPGDIERSADDPRLAALAALGWTVAASQVTQIRARGPEGEVTAQRLTLVLWPPPPSVAAGRWAVAQRAVWFVAGLAWLVSALIGLWR